MEGASKEEHFEWNKRVERKADEKRQAREREVEQTGRTAMDAVLTGVGIKRN